MNEQQQPPELLTVQEVADIMRMTSQGIRDAIKRGDLQAVKMGRVYRVPKSEIDRIINTPVVTDHDEQ